ncbi:MAG: GYD domain-containing protein [Candidatus Bathyarchaeota archaeon]|nr:GYD domain-containing protein [Candidatus Bathyarchaeota archaeon]
MPTYIVLMKATPKGLATPKTLLQDVQAASAAVEKFGGKQLDWNLTMGQYDAVAKVEFPDDHSMAAFALAVAATGNQETITMRAFSQAELAQIVEKIP